MWCIEADLITYFINIIYIVEEHNINLGMNGKYNCMLNILSLPQISLKVIVTTSNTIHTIMSYKQLY